MFLYRVLCFLIGLVIATLGSVFLLITFSLLTMGGSLSEYFFYLRSQFQIFLFPLGIFLMIVSLFFDNMWDYFLKLKVNRRRRGRALNKKRRKL